MINKLYLYAAIALLLVGGGYYAGYQNRQVITEREVVEVETEVLVEKEAEIKWRDRTVIVERIVHPDGTIEERTIQKDQELEEHRKELATLKEQLKQERDKKVILPVLSKYSLGVQMPVKFPEQETTIKEVSLLVGVRLLGPVWAEGQFQPSSKSAAVGIRYEF